MEIKQKNPHAVAMGKLGGKACGPCKSRGSEGGRKAVNVRWERYRAAKAAAVKQSEGGEV